MPRFAIGSCYLRHRWLAVAIGIVGWLAADVPSRAQTPQPAPETEVRLIYAGDIMLGELPGQAIVRGVDPFAEFADVLKKADMAIGNLECVVATGGKEVWKNFVFRAHPRVLPVLGRHFGAVSLANVEGV